MAERAEVVFVDGVRTPFGRAGEKGQYWNTRADDLIVKAMVGLLERNPNLPPERVDDVGIAATTQTGDQGLTIGRTAAILAGLPLSVPGYALDRMCAGAMTTVSTIGSEGTHRRSRHRGDHPARRPGAHARTNGRSAGRTPPVCPRVRHRSYVRRSHDERHHPRQRNRLRSV